MSKIFLVIVEEKAGTALSFRCEIDLATLDYLMQHCNNPAEVAASMLRMIRTDDCRAHGEPAPELH